MQPAAESALLRALVDRSGVIIAVFSPVGTLLDCNETLYLNAGLTRDDFVGKSVSELDVSFPIQTLDQWNELVRRIESEVAIAVETQLRRQDGSLYRARFTVSRQDYQGERYLLAVGHMIPDSVPLRAELEREARWRRALLEIATHEAVAAGDIRAAAGLVARLAREVLPADSCGIWKRGDGWSQVGDIQSKLGLEQYPWLIRELESRSVCDFLETGRMESEWQEAQDLVARHGRAMMAAPIRISGEVWGLLTFQSERPRHWSADELAFAAEVASQLVHCVLNNQRNQMERELRASEERYRSFLEMSEELVWRVEFDAPIPLALPVETQVDMVLNTGFMADCNDFMARFFGAESTEQLRGSRLSNLLAPLNEARRAEIRAMAVNQYHVTNIPVSHRVRGQDRWVLRSSQGVVENGCLIRLWGAARDITERKLAEDQLHISDQRYRAFVTYSSEGIFRIDYPNPIPITLPPEKIVERSWYEGRLAECNQALAELWGFGKPEDVIGRPSTDFRLATREEWQQELDLVLGGFRLSGAERPVQTANGAAKWIRYSALGIVKDGLLTGLWGTVSDVTERKAMEAELRSLSARNTTIMEEERARVAREIHDELGQQLTVLKFEASAWEGGKRKPTPGGLTKEIDTAIQTVRRIATELRPVILDQYGLAAAVEWQAKEFSRRTGIECACEVEGCDQIPDELATPVFRILQEGLTNVARHSGASNVEIQLVRSGNRLDLELRDNGKGLAPAAGENPESLGLAGMRERALYAGGAVMVSSVPGQGTLVSASFPLNASAKVRP